MKKSTKWKEKCKVLFIFCYSELLIFFLFLLPKVLYHSFEAMKNDNINLWQAISAAPPTKLSKDSANATDVPSTSSALMDMSPIYVSQTEQLTSNTHPSTSTPLENVVESKRKKLGSNVCKVCLKEFSMSSSARRHERSHRDFRKFFCDICSTELRSERSLENHKKGVNHRRRVKESQKLKNMANTFEDKMADPLGGETGQSETSLETVISRCDLCSVYFPDVINFQRHLSSASHLFHEESVQGNAEGDNNQVDDSNGDNEEDGQAEQPIDFSSFKSTEYVTCDQVDTEEQQEAKVQVDNETFVILKTLETSPLSTPLSVNNPENVENQNTPHPSTSS